VLVSFVKDASSTGWPKKVSHFQIIKKSYQIVLQPVNEIRFIRQIKVWIDGIWYSMRDLLSDLNNYAWPANKRYAWETV